MKSESRHRRTIRLPDRTYAEPGVYFVTIRAAGELAPFGILNGGDVELSDVGAFAARLWETIPHRYTRVRVDRYVFMPDHMHGILIITGEVGKSVSCRPGSGPAAVVRHGGVHPGSIAAIIQGFKAAVTLNYRKRIIAPEAPVWQRGYYERVVRDLEDLMAVRRYIEENPARARAARGER